MRGAAGARADVRDGRARARSLIGVVAVVVTLGAQLAGLAHLALVAHVPCAVDGEPVHRDPGAPPGAPDSEGHDHCVLAAHGISALHVESAARALAPPAVQTVEPVAPLPEPPPTPIAIRFLAPKLPPPV